MKQLEGEATDHCQKGAPQDGGLPELIVARSCLTNHSEPAGTWHEMAIELTQEIGRRITTITEDTRETTFLFQHLSMALQRGNAVSFHDTMVTE